MGAQSTVSVALIYRGDELQPETTAHALSGEMLPSRDEAVAADDGEQFVAVKFAKESRTTTLVDDTPSAQAQAQAQGMARRWVSEAAAIPWAPAPASGQASEQEGEAAVAAERTGAPVPRG
jgi:hypothetical protein